MYACMSHGTHVGIRGQHGKSCFSLPCGLQRSNSGHPSTGFWTCSLRAEPLRPALSSCLAPALEFATVAFMRCEMCCVFSWDAGNTPRQGGILGITLSPISVPFSLVGKRNMNFFGIRKTWRQ